MKDALATATYWAPLLETVADIAFAVVIVALAVELVSGRIAKRFERHIDAARELRIAELNNETARLRKQIGPRQIDSEAFKKSLEGKPKAPVELMYQKENGEAFMLALAIRDSLRFSEWQVSEPIPVPPTDVERLKNEPSHMAAGAQAMGVAVVIRADSQADFKLLGPAAPGHPRANSPANAISDALGATLGGVAGYIAGSDVFDAPPSGTVRIVVGPKP